MDVTNPVFNSFEKNASEFFCVSVYGVFKFTAENTHRDFLSNMCNNMIPFITAVGERKTHFFNSTFFSTSTSTNDCVHADDYHLWKFGQNLFTEMTIAEIHSCLKSEFEKKLFEGEDELVGESFLKHFNGIIEILLIFNQKCALIFNSPSIYAFRQFGHQFVRENALKLWM